MIASALDALYQMEERMGQPVYHLSIVRSGARPLSPVEQKHARELPRLKALPSVFCMIAGEDVSVRRCLSQQGGKECFGCAAPSRLCEACRGERVAFPEVGFCDRCMEHGLAEESKLPPPDLPNVSVLCRLSGGKHVSATTCRKIQGSGCDSCPAPTRLCQSCKLRAAYYPDYGLCLGCTAARFGRGWLEAHQSAVSAAAPGAAAPRPALALVPATPVVVPKIPRPKSLQNPCTRCKEAPIYFVKLGLCLECFTARWRRNAPRGAFFETKETEAAFLALLPRIIQLLTRSRWVNARKFQSALGLSNVEAHAAIAKLEEHGVVSDSEGGMHASLLRLVTEFAPHLVALRDMDITPGVRQKTLPSIDRRGRIVIRGTVYLTAHRWQKRLNRPVMARLKAAGTSGIIGLSYPGRSLARFFSADDVLAALVSPKKQPTTGYNMDPHGYWDTLSHWAKYFGVRKKDLSLVLRRILPTVLENPDGGNDDCYEWDEVWQPLSAYLKRRIKRAAR